MGLVSDLAVNDFFDQAGADGSGTAVYARRSQGATLRDVYYGHAMSPAIIRHESLHIFFGPNLNDPDLAERLGATKDVFANEGSNVITRLLAEHGCH
jgi:hypothetical protein